MNQEHDEEQKEKDQFVMMLAVVQGQDAEIAEDVLEENAFSVTRLPSVGGFLGKRSATFLLGVPTGKEEYVKSLLEQTCRKRVTYISVPLENAPIPMPMPTPVTVGGVSLFTLEIEHHEEY